MMARHAWTAAIALLFAVNSAQAQWGTLKGKFIYDGKAPSVVKLDVNKDVEVCGKHNLVDESLVIAADGGIANVVIYVRSKGVKVHPDLAAPPGPVVYDNKGCRFEPHILPVLVGQTVVLQNTDPVGHNSSINAIGDTSINPLIPPGGAIEHKFNRAQFIPVQVSCTIHPWMRGYILPRDNPYTAITGKDGTFELKNLPAGELEFVAWHERIGYVALPGWERGRFTMKIAAGDNDLGERKVPVSLFK